MVCRDLHTCANAAAALKIPRITINRSGLKHLGLPRSDAVRIVDFRYFGTDLQE
jgi:hypothetical protein